MRKIQKHILPLSAASPSFTADNLKSTSCNSLQRLLLSLQIISKAHPANLHKCRPSAEELKTASCNSLQRLVCLSADVSKLHPADLCTLSCFTAAQSRLCFSAEDTKLHPAERYTVCSPVREIQKYIPQNVAQSLFFSVRRMENRMLQVLACCLSSSHLGCWCHSRHGFTKVQS